MSNNLRKLTAEELKLVSGGSDTITVTGSRYDYWDNYDPWAYMNDSFGYEDFYYDNGGDSGGGYDGTGGPEEDHSLAEATEAALQITEAKHNIIQDLINRHGPNVVVNLPDGTQTTLGALHEGIGRVFTGLQAAITVGELIDGGKNVHDAINFLFGVTVTAMAAQAGAGAFLAGALGFTAEYAAGHILEWMEGAGRANAWLQDYFQAEVAEWVQNNSTPAEYTSPMDMLRGMFGWERNPYQNEYQYQIP
jgi:hypothetical protein